MRFTKVYSLEKYLKCIEDKNDFFIKTLEEAKCKLKDLEIEDAEGDKLL